jgi:hypothetical protein
LYIHEGDDFCPCFFGGEMDQIFDGMLATGFAIMFVFGILSPRLNFLIFGVILINVSVIGVAIQRQNWILVFILCCISVWEAHAYFDLKKKK